MYRVVCTKHRTTRRMKTWICIPIYGSLRRPTWQGGESEVSLWEDRVESQRWLCGRTGWRVESQWWQGGEPEVSLWEDRVESQRWVCGRTGWRVRGESVGGQGGESEVSLWEDRVESQRWVYGKTGCETVSPSMVQTAITLERKWTRKRHRLKWIHRFSSCVFILGSGKDQRNFSSRFRIRSNIIPPSLRRPMWQGGESRGQSVGGGCETVSPSMVHHTGVCDRVESQRWVCEWTGWRVSGECGWTGWRVSGECGWTGWIFRGEPVGGQSKGESGWTGLSEVILLIDRAESQVSVDGQSWELEVSLWVDRVECMGTQPEMSLHMDWIERRITGWRVMGDSLDKLEKKHVCFARTPVPPPPPTHTQKHRIITTRARSTTGR